MKNYKKILAAASLLIGFSSCDYLDIVPDEIPTDKDAFLDTNAAQRYMYSCYSYLPEPRHGTGSIDFMTGDEVVTAFEHETFASFPKGNYTASNPVISYWNTFFQGIRQCYLLINNVDKVPGLEPELKADYVAQAKFLLGYYHFLLVRCYGPVILIKEEPKLDTPPSQYLGRSSYDECVDFVCGLLDEAAAGLPSKRPAASYGLATNVIAKAIKAKMLLYAASPLFNGNSEFYADFTDKEGNHLMPLNYDANKWVKAKNALEEAIQLAESEGYALYTATNYNHGNLEPKDPTQHCLRYNIMEAGNPEILWADSRGEGYYGMQNKSMPFCSASAWNGVAPTLTMVKRFYTKNGLPIDQDPTYSQDYYAVVTVSEEQKHQAAAGEQTLSINLDREPRYYAWIGFQGGFYEVISAQSNGAYANDASYRKYSDMSGYTSGKLVCNFLKGGNVSRYAEVSNPRTNNYSPTGFLNKKGVDPANSVSTGLKTPYDYPWPIMRLAELYLSYAEACVETNDLTTAKQYLNKVRERAGIPTVETSWEEIAQVTLDQDKLREIVRQERQIEFYLENQNFWDLRRWKVAEKYFGVSAQGMDIAAATLQEFGTVKDVIFERKFNSPTQYLMPIPLSDVNKNTKLVNNPGY